MPPKVRELIKALEKTGFKIEAVRVATEIIDTLEGCELPFQVKLGDDARIYQQKEVKKKIEKSKS